MSGFSQGFGWRFSSLGDHVFNRGGGGGGYCERSYGQGKEDVVSMVLGFVRLGLLELLGAPSLS